MTDEISPPRPAASMEEMEARLFAVERPERALLKHYIIQTLMTGPLAPIVFPAMYFRYHTLRYKFDREGISMKWGILFRREVNLTYSRIQDIHLSSGIIERWLGLARVQIQTASASASAEMTIEGLSNYEELRDYLYLRMRGEKQRSTSGEHSAPGAVAASGELAGILREIAGEVRALREGLGGVAAPAAGVLPPPPEEEGLRGSSRAMEAEMPAEPDDEEPPDADLPRSGPPHPPAPNMEDRLDA